MSAAQEPPRGAKGHRPQIFDDPAVDQLYAAYVTLATELSVAFERIDTLERLLETESGLSREAIRNYQPDESVSAERQRQRAELAERLLRPFREFREQRIARANHLSDTSPSD
ncbi:MAG: hypothetical protein FGM43_03370 [Sinobacteraceae bacterium]|nr:hypothetical protein [Nevskiaceae bacterium]